MYNQIHINKDFGWFIGAFDNNQKHKHYAIQLSIPIEGRILVETSEHVIQTDEPVLIKSNIIHKISSESDHFLLLINPASTIGHYWNNLALSETQKLTNKATIQLAECLKRNQQEHLVSKLNSIILHHDCFCSTAIHHGDDRINKALKYLAHHAEKVIPLEEIAQHCHLSPSRFLHLFKEETGITYRRAQLWNKLSKSISQFGTISFTEIAYSNGFSDSGHFSRTFKENFGFSPRDFIKISQFIQV